VKQYDSIVSMTENAYQALESLGSSLCRDVEFRDSWAMIGVKGAPQGSVPEVHVAKSNGHADIQSEFPRLYQTEGYRFVYQDHIGSTRQLSRSDMQRDYYPFGQTLNAAGDDLTSMQFSQKQVAPDSNIYYFGVRTYSPRIGRWLVPDPAGQGFSPYVYCGNNPLMFVDPNGLLSIGNIFINLTLNAAGIASFILTGGHFGFVGWVDESNNWNVYAGGWWSGGLPGAGFLNFGKNADGYHAFGSSVIDIGSRPSMATPNQKKSTQGYNTFNPSVSIHASDISMPGASGSFTPQVELAALAFRGRSQYLDYNITHWDYLSFDNNYYRLQLLDNGLPFRDPVFGNILWENMDPIYGSVSSDVPFYLDPASLIGFKFGPPSAKFVYGKAKWGSKLAKSHYLRNKYSIDDAVRTTYNVMGPPGGINPYTKYWQRNQDWLTIFYELYKHFW
jgi:RHS repeat-associated protein